MEKKFEICTCVCVVYALPEDRDFGGRGFG